MEKDGRGYVSAGPGVGKGDFGLRPPLERMQVAEGAQTSRRGCAAWVSQQVAVATVLGWHSCNQSISSGWRHMRPLPNKPDHLRRGIDVAYPAAARYQTSRETSEA
jgi:hypothetical protein